ncbi:hypothetical protein R1sor_010521 [Riccia sorocarpa]|uniref:Uncharacterized protein n=1 Tax=Riccia sorocarpa TaxID=122646 RepID=A0ABD3I1V3_9MARC
MSLQGLSLVVPTKTCTLAPLVASSSRNVLRPGKVSLVQYSGDLRTVESLGHFMLKLRRVPSSRRFHSPLLLIQSGYRPAGLQATSFQAITADDSSSGEAMGPSAHALSLSPDEFKQFLVAFFSKFQDGLRQMKERGLVESTKQGFQEAFVKLKSVDGNRVFEEDVATKISSQGTATWQTVKPWVKWPLAIFISIYMVVTAGFGPAVSRDLIPLWILGPLVTGAIVRSAYWVVEITRDAFVVSAPVRQAVGVGVAQVFEDAKNGVLGGKVKHQVEKKRRELKELATNKRAELVFYVQSGQAANDFKEYLQLRFSDFYEWSVEKYEDFVDWWRPFMRAFIRLMKKLF